MKLFFRQVGLTKVIYDEVECGKEGVYVDHEESATFLFWNRLAS
jgi:hypothetical protein